MRNGFVICLCLTIASSVSAEEKPQGKVASPWRMQDSKVKASLRGLHVVNDQIVWASGTGGTVLRTIDAGATWKVTIVKGAEELDFRDIHAFDESSAVITSAGTPARVYRTDDGGMTWKKTFEHASEQAFFDALSFWNDKDGIIMSDPVDGRVLLITTSDGGKSWIESKPENRPIAVAGEAGFAASGTNMVVRKDGVCLIALGGANKGEQFEESRIAISVDQGQTWKFSKARMARNQSSGIFSMAFADNQVGVAVGGDYLKPAQTSGNIAVTTDGGKTWKAPTGTIPSGFRSGVAINRNGKRVYCVAVGTNGTDWSLNNGNDWTRLSSDAFHAIGFSPSGKSGWASGGDGRIGKWIKDSSK